MAGLLKSPLKIQSRDFPGNTKLIRSMGKYIRQNECRLLISIIPITFLVLMVNGCIGKSGKDVVLENQYSETQRRLFKILDDYHQEYALAKDEELKDGLQKKYSTILQAYSIDSLGQVFDSIAVTVDSVVIDGFVTRTQFHTKDIEFKFQLDLKDTIAGNTARYYRFLQNLKPDSEVILNFKHIGGTEINKPGDMLKKTFRIFAYPTPLDL